MVDEARRLLGTFSDADLRRALTRIGESVLMATTRELMNYGKGAFPRVTTPSAMAFDAHVTMEAGNPVEYLPVISEDGGKDPAGAGHHARPGGVRDVGADGGAESASRRLGAKKRRENPIIGTKNVT